MMECLENTNGLLYNAIQVLNLDDFPVSRICKLVKPSTPIRDERSLLHYMRFVKSSHLTL